MKSLQNFIVGSNINSVNENAYWNRINRTHENMFHYLRDYSPTIYNALLYMSDILLVVARYGNKYNVENIDWKKAIKKWANDDVLLDKDAIRALMDGESKCKPEYKLMVRCAEAEFEKKGGYKIQLEKALKSIN